MNAPLVWRSLSEQNVYCATDVAGSIVAMATAIIEMILGTFMLIQVVYHISTGETIAAAPRRVVAYLVPGAGLEPARPKLGKGF